MPGSWQVSASSTPLCHPPPTVNVISNLNVPTSTLGVATNKGLVSTICTYPPCAADLACRRGGLPPLPFSSAEPRTGRTQSANFGISAPLSIVSGENFSGLYSSLLGTTFKRCNHKDCTALLEHFDISPLMRPSWSPSYILRFTHPHTPTLSCPAVTNQVESPALPNFRVRLPWLHTQKW